MSRLGRLFWTYHISVDISSFVVTTVCGGKLTVNGCLTEISSTMQRLENQTFLGLLLDAIQLQGKLLFSRCILPRMFSSFWWIVFVSLRCLITWSSVVGVETKLDGCMKKSVSVDFKIRTIEDALRHENSQSSWQLLVELWSSQ